MQTMSRQEFEEEYATRSGVTMEWLREIGQISLPCNCEEEGCQGWQMRGLATINAYDLQFIAEPYRSEVELLLATTRHKHRRPRGVKTTKTWPMETWLPKKTWLVRLTVDVTAYVEIEKDWSEDAVKFLVEPLVSLAPPGNSAVTLEIENTRIDDIVETTNHRAGVRWLTHHTQFEETSPSSEKH